MQPGVGRSPARRARPGPSASRDAVAISRETGVWFVGAWALGMLARLTERARIRQEALADGEAILDQGDSSRLTGRWAVDACSCPSSLP